MDSYELFRKLRPYLIIWLCIFVFFIVMTFSKYGNLFSKYISDSFVSMASACLMLFGIIYMFYRVIFPRR